MNLTPTQEDYLEMIWRLSDADSVGVRTTDLADRLDCRLPTVTRTVRKMVDGGFVRHESRGLIHLTTKGKQSAAHIAHRHSDAFAFLTQILGLSARQAEADACQIEHGLSPLAAQRLHEFLEYVNTLNENDRAMISRFATKRSNRVTAFSHLPNGKTAGWRG